MKTARKIVAMRRHLEEMPYFKFVSFQLIQMLLLGIIEAIIITSAAKILDAQSTETSAYYDKSYLIWTKDFAIGALCETLVFQFILFLFFQILFKFRTLGKSKGIAHPLLYITISSVIFGFYHNGSNDMIILDIIIVIEHVLSGIILATSYYILQRKRQLPILSVSLIHFLFNEIWCGLLFILYYAFN